jgi:polyisoprenoid-binding protein YceI
VGRNKIDDHLSFTVMKTSPRRLWKFLLALCMYAIPALPVSAEVYEFDKVHTQILFFVDHFGFSKSQGEFLDFEGQFTFDRNNFEKSAVRIIIDAESIDMDDDKWNRKMAGKKYFNTGTHRTIEFESTRIERVDESNARVHGNLTLLGTTRPITLEMRFNKAGLNIATGKKTAGFSGHASLMRSDFGMRSYLKYIGDEVEIRLEVEGAIEPFRKNDS